MKLIDKNQLDYIKVLSSYDSSNEKDNKIINDYCSIKKKTLESLNTTEASELIEDLLQVQVVFTFGCGAKKLLNKQVINRGNILGKLEICLHSCPFNINVNDCEYWQNK